MLALAEIDLKNVTLNAQTLGNALSDRLRRLLLQPDLQLPVNNCKKIAASETVLEFTGILPHFFAWRDVPVRCRLFDRASQDRQLMFIAALPDDADAYDYIEQYRRSGEKVRRFTSLLDIYVQTFIPATETIPAIN